MPRLCGLRATHSAGLGTARSARGEQREPEGVRGRAQTFGLGLVGRHWDFSMSTRGFQQVTHENVSLALTLGRAV